MRAAVPICPAQGTPGRARGSQLPSAHAGLVPAQRCLAGPRVAGVSVCCRNESGLAGCPLLGWCSALVRDCLTLLLLTRFGWPALHLTEGMHAMSCTNL